MTGGLQGSWSPAMATFVASAESPAFRSIAGLEWRDLTDGHLEQSMTLSAAMCEADGRGAVGVLGVLTDSTLGTAAAAARDGARGIVTLGLHIDMTGVLPGVGSTISMRTERVIADGDEVWVAATVAYASHTIGWVTWRGLLVDFAGRQARLRAEGTPARVAEIHDPSPGWSVDDTLRIQRLRHEGEEARLVARPPASFASGWRTLHGGAVVLLASRATHDVASRGTTEAVRCLSLDAEFFRTVPSGADALVTGSMVHRGRSYVTAEGRVLLEDGRPAAVVRTTGALTRR